MNDVQVASMTMNKYGIDADIKVAIGDFASMIYMIGSYVDTGPGAVEPIREAVWVKVLEAKKLVDTYPELREEEGELRVVRGAERRAQLVERPFRENNRALYGMLSGPQSGRP